MALARESTTTRPPGRTLPLFSDTPDLGIILQEVEQTLAHVRDFLESVRAAQDCPPLPDLDLPERLAPRERTVLRLVAAGRRNREIAGDLSLSISTIKAYLPAAMGKLGARNRVDAVRIARAYRLI